MRSFFNVLCCRCCGGSNPLEECNDTTRVMPCGNKSLVSKDALKAFERNEIRFFGMFEKDIINRAIDLNVINKSGIKKISFGLFHSIFLFSN